jgi:predicted Fe-Mo cluster-binding NifX family protein
MKPERIAVVSTDGLNVDEHFGKAERFLIYDLQNMSAPVEERASETLSVGDPKHSFDVQKFNRITALLHDCRKVYVTRIGTVPKTKLQEMGIEPVIYQGAITDIIDD